MEYLIQILSIVTWPITIFVISLLFKLEVKKMITRLTSLKYRDFEAIFTNDLNEIGKQAQGIKNIEKSTSIILIKEIENRLDRLVAISPKAAILEAWSEIEELSYKIGLTSGTVIPKVSQKTIVEYLHSTNKFSNLEIKLIEDLRRLRNMASHASDVEISITHAKTYLNISKKIISLLQARMNEKQSNDRN